MQRDEAYHSYNSRLFLDQDSKRSELVSALDNEKYLDAISAPRLDQKGNPRVRPMTKRMKAQQTDEALDNEDNAERQIDGTEAP